MRMTALRESTTIKPTAEDCGLELTITLKAYDNGKLYIDGKPMIDHECPERGWSYAIATCAEKVGELQRQAIRRRRAA